MNWRPAVSTVVHDNFLPNSGKWPAVSAPFYIIIIIIIKIRGENITNLSSTHKIYIHTKMKNI